MGPADIEHGYEFGPFRLDVVRHRLLRGDQPVPLTPRGFDTLLTLVRYAGRVVEKDELMRLVWPDTSVVDDNLTQQISSLRKALGDHSDEPTYILTIPRRGYQFLSPVRTVADEPAADRRNEPSQAPAVAKAGPHEAAATSSSHAVAAPPQLPATDAAETKATIPIGWIAGAIAVSVVATASVMLAASR